MSRLRKTQNGASKPKRPEKPHQLRLAERRKTEAKAATDASKRAVSDAIGFSLMFGIIIVGVGIVSVAGVGDIIEFGDREEVATAERGMEAAAASMDKLNLQADMNRSIDLVIGTGNIWVNDTSMTFDGPDELVEQIGPNENDGTVPIYALEHRFSRNPEDVTIGYEGGGVYQSHTASALYRPSFKCRTGGQGPDSAIVTVVNLTTDDAGINVAVDYSREFAIDPTDLPEESPVAAFAATVTLQANLHSVNSYTTASATESLQIDVSETSYPEQWSLQLERHNWEQVTSNVYECDAESIVVRVSTIELQRLI